MSGTTPFDGTRPVIPSPTTRASPVAPDSAPRESPPPNRRMVPQSICAACFQVSVERWVRLIGNAKSRIAPVRAATASGTLDSTATAKGWSRPRKRGSRPGPIQSDTVAPNAMTALRSPGFHGPSARRRSAMSSSAPGISPTPVRPTRLRTKNRACAAPFSAAAAHLEPARSHADSQSSTVGSRRSVIGHMQHPCGLQADAYPGPSRVCAGVDDCQGLAGLAR